MDIIFDKGCLVTYNELVSNKGEIQFWNCVSKTENNTAINEINVEIPRCAANLNQCSDKKLIVNRYNNKTAAINGEGKYGGFGITGLLYSHNKKCLFLPCRIFTSGNIINYFLNFPGGCSGDFKNSLERIPTLTYFNSINSETELTPHNCRRFALFARTEIFGQGSDAESLKSTIQDSLLNINIDINRTEGMYENNPAFKGNVHYCCFQDLLPNVGKHRFENPFIRPLIIPVP